MITTYGLLTRLPWLRETDWRLVVLDEAQAIKNPASRQTSAVKELRAQARIALTGTPVENRLGDLWSLFSFICPGLLGSAAEFGRTIKRLSDDQGRHFAPLRNLTRPYILRRLKTDKSIISDLPEKTEVGGVVCVEQSAGCALPAVGQGTGRKARNRRRHPAARADSGISDAVQADLQSSFALARRRRIRSCARAGSLRGYASWAKRSPRARRRRWFSPSSEK